MDDLAPETSYGRARRYRNPDDGFIVLARLLAGYRCDIQDAAKRSASLEARKAMLDPKKVAAINAVCLNCIQTECPGECAELRKSIGQDEITQKKTIEWHGHRKTVSEWAEIFGIPKRTIYRRMRMGLSVDEILEVGQEDKQVQQHTDSMIEEVYLRLSRMHHDYVLYWDKLYASAVGGALGQFTQEATNEVSFLIRDLMPYLGVDAKSGNPLDLRGIIKALTAAFIMAWGYYGINEVVGGNAAIDPIGSYKKAKGNADEKATVWDVASAMGTNLAQTLNPIENITGGNLLDAPMPSALRNTFTDLWDGGKGFTKEIYDALYNDDPNDSFDFSWAENFADAMLEWLPGGTAMKRVKSAIQAADRGYAQSASGNIKYVVNKDGFDLPFSALFGTSASREGRDYTYGRVRQLNKPETEQAKELIENGFAPSDAIRYVRGSKERSEVEKQAAEAARWGDDNAELLEKAKSLRKDAGMPADMSAYAAENANAPWMRKAIDLYNETGLVTYPKGLGSRIKEGERNGEKVKYLQSGGKNYAVTDDEVQRMTDEYNRKAALIINNSDDPEEIASKLNALPDKIKKEFLGGK